MTLARSLFALAVAAALAPGCGKKKDDAQDGTSAATTTKQAKPTAALDATFFGKKPAPLGLLAKLPWGTPVADAKTKVPELFGDGDGDKTKLVDDPAVQDVTYGVGFHKDTHRLDRMYIQLPATAKALLETAWGPGKAATDSIDRPRTYWFDAESGWRAYLEPGFGDDVNLVFHPYIPAAKLLGDGPDGLGFAPQPILGATVDDLRAQFKDTIVEETADQAAKKQAEVSKFAGKDLEKELGKAKANARLELLPTEWEEYWTRVNFHWSDDGKVEVVYFKVPFEAHPAAKDELKALFDKKWGAPKEAKEYGSTGDPIFVYRDKDPRITVKEDTISAGWDIKVSSRPN